MKNRAATSIGLLCLLLGGCVECEQTYTLNPDGSGKVAVTLVTPFNPFEQALGGGKDKRPSLAEKKRLFLDKLLRTAQGVAAWADVSADYTPEGRLKFQGTAYLKDLKQLKSETALSSPARLVPQADGSLRLVFNPENLKPNLPNGDKEEAPDARKLTDKELDEYILGKRVEYQSGKGLLTAMLTDLKFTYIFRLPGDVSEVKAYRAEGKRAVSLVMDGNKILKATNDLMARDNAFFRKHLRAGGHIEAGLGGSAEGLKALGLDWHEAAATVARPAGPQFNYGKEVAAARKAYPALRKRLGLGEEKKVPDFPGPQGSGID